VATDARQRLIEAAEALIAEHGVAAVSMRHIADAAGQRNTSAVAYHFGSKAALVQAVYADRMRGPDARRVVLLAELDAAGAGQDLRALATVFVQPLVEVLSDTSARATPPGRPSTWLRFLVHALYGAQLAPQLGQDDFTAGMHRLRERIARHLSPLPEPVRELRWDAMVRLVLHTLADHEAAVAAGRPVAPLAAVAMDLVDVLVATVLARATSYAAMASAVSAR
jgi:AcrR family transcriptional regulator